MRKCRKSVFVPNNNRREEIRQLEAEKAFILDALKTIRQQRNALLVERLHLENTKQQLENDNFSPDEIKEPEVQGQSAESKRPTEPQPNVQYPPMSLMSTLDLMSPGCSRDMNHDSIKKENTKCNNEELKFNLDLPGSSSYDSMYTKSEHDYYGDDDTSSEVSDEDDMVVDISMLMNSTAEPN